MKVTLRTIAGLLSSAVMVSCSNVNDDPDISQTPIEFGTTMSRAAVSSDKKRLSSFSVWGGYEGAEDLFNKTEVDPSGAYTDGNRYWIPGKTFNFYAVHPVLENASVDNGIITVNNFDCSKTGAEAVDLMTATAQRITKNPMVPEDVQAVPLTFNHELARIVLVAQKYPNSENIKGYEPTVHTAKLFGMYKSGDLKINYTDDLTVQQKEWKIPSLENKGEQPTNTSSPLVNITEQKTIPEDSKEIVVFDVLVFPQDIEATYCIDFTYSAYNTSEESEHSKLLLNTLPIKSWTAGKQYKYSFTITPEDLIIFNVPEVETWKESTGGIITVE